MFNDNKNLNQDSAPERESMNAGTHTDSTSPVKEDASSQSYSYTAQNPNYHTPYGQYYQQPQPSQPQQNSYSWGPGQSSPQSYYTQPIPTPPQPKPKKKGRAGKFLLRTLAAVLACAVVSLGSVGVFAAMIQNGVVNVQSAGEENSTAAFTLYKKADSGKSATPTATLDNMTTQEIANKLIPSVVCVQNYQVNQQQGGGFYFGGFYVGGGQGQQEEGGELSPAGEGSGIIISKDGYIVTNQHVIDGATNISVVTSDGTTYEARLVGEDTQTDLAVLKIDTSDELTPAEFGDSGDLQVTDQVLAIGNPGGMQFNSSVTIGYVSALNRPVTNSDTGFVVNCIQTDAAINPGNSGGALVDSNGLVVGINSSKIAATDYEGMGFAIPSSIAQPIVSDLIEYGYVKDRPMLGIKGTYLDRMQAGYFGFSQGFCVGSVDTENAKASGLQMYDVITAIDDTQVTSSSTIASYIANKKPGDKVTLTVDRSLTGEKGVKIELVLSENAGTTE